MLKCVDCKEEMAFIDCNDNPNNGYAYNIYHCIPCMIIYRENVWNNLGIAVIRKEDKPYVQLNCDGEK
jgi:hypothetical protein